MNGNASVSQYIYSHRQHIGLGIGLLWQRQLVQAQWSARIFLIFLFYSLFF